MPDFDKQHRNNMRKYVAQTEKEYLAFAADVARIADDPKAKFQRSFKFANNLDIQKRVDKATNGFAANLLSVVSKGVDAEWKLSDSKNDIHLKNTLKIANKLGAEGYNPHNADALKRFLDRKENGMGISDRVWKNASGFKDELEKHIQLGILNGDSADVVSRRIRQNLNEPDKLFRRVRDKNGNLVFSKKALDYRPGRGVYRSSYANARRLVITETNMAFRRADYERWKNDPKVVGFEVKLSGNHPTNDICDQLKGKYPKTFLWTGWHPQCRCYATPILLSDKDFSLYQDSVLEDKPFNPTNAAGYVGELPKSFTEWADQNKERLEAMAENGKSPTFVKDNFRDSKVEAGLKSETGKDEVLNVIMTKSEALKVAKEAEERGEVILYRGDVRDKGMVFSPENTDYALDGKTKNQAGFNFFSDKNGYAEDYATTAMNESIRAKATTPNITVVSLNKDVKMFDFRELTAKGAAEFELEIDKYHSGYLDGYRRGLMKDILELDDKKLAKKYPFLFMNAKKEIKARGVINHPQTYSDFELGSSFKKYLQENGYEGFVFQEYQMGAEYGVLDTKAFKVIAKYYL